MKSRFSTLCINGGIILQSEPKYRNCVRAPSLLCLTYVLFKEKNINQIKHYLFWKLAAFIIVPVIQREVDIFKDNVSNIHRIRDQKGVYLSSGVLNHIYNFPEEHNLRQYGKI